MNSSTFPQPNHWWWNLQGTERAKGFFLSINPGERMSIVQLAMEDQGSLRRFFNSGYRVVARRVKFLQVGMGDSIDEAR